MDTIYFSNTWDQTNFRNFASYYRVVEKGDSLSVKKYKDYYQSGVLQGEGSVITIGMNDSLSVFDGDQVNYYKSGTPETYRSFKNGVLDGDYYDFDENGLIKVKRRMKNGKDDGLYTEFRSDGTYVQVEYKDGEYAFPYYYYGDRDGRVSRIRLADNNLYFKQLNRNERKVYYREGATWQYYENEGMTVAMTVTQVKEYGRFFKIDVILTNNTVAPILFNSTDLVGKLTYSYGETSLLKTWTVEEYMKRVKNRQAWATAAMEFAEGMATASAGYSTSNSFSTMQYSGNITTYGSNAGYSRYSGTANTYTTTTTYNAAAAYQAKVLSAQRMDAFNKEQWYDYQVKNAGYLKLNTVFPGESISGFVMLERRNGSLLTIEINVAGIPYYFDWNVSR